MRNGVHSIYRRYACLVAQAVLDPIAEDYVDRWLHAVERGDYPPDVAELFEAAGAEGIPVLSPIPVHAYLRQCAKTGRIPDPVRIVQAIAHAWAEGDLMNVGKTCHCPARRPLFQRPARSNRISPLPKRDLCISHLLVHNLYKQRRLQEAWGCIVH